METMKKCWFCKEEIPETTRICSWCGRRQDEMHKTHYGINPFSTDSFFRGEDLVFKCPTCPNAVSVTRQQIDSIIGANVVCSVCQNVAHVPGGYKTEPKPSSLKITGGVQVPIAQFVKWFFAHPLVVSLEKSQQSSLLYDYGLWGFCPGCYHEYSGAVLGYSFPFVQIAQNSAGYLLIASTPDSAKDTTSLESGHCPSCGHESLIVIVADIPDYVRSFIETNREKGAGYRLTSVSRVGEKIEPK